MRYRDLLLEYDEAKTIANYGEALVDRYEEEQHIRIDPSAILFKLSKADPTPKKAYILHLVRWYLDRSMQRLEDASKAHAAFELYGKFRNRGLPAINTLDFNQFLDLGDELQGGKSKAELTKEEEEGFYARGEAKLLKNTAKIKIVQLLSEEAAKFFGRNTRWCTASERDNMFKHYDVDGKLYTIIFKGQGSKKWQFFFPHTLDGSSCQFMDELDREIDRDVAHDEPEVLKFFQNEFAACNAVEMVIDPDTLSDRVKEDVISEYGPSITYFEKPTERMIKFAVKDARTVWSSLPKHAQESEQLQLMGLRANSKYERYFDYPNPTSRVTKEFEANLKEFIDRVVNYHDIKMFPLHAFKSNSPKCFKYAMEHLIPADLVKAIEQQL